MFGYHSVDNNEANRLQTLNIPTNVKSSYFDMRNEFHQLKALYHAHEIIYNEFCNQHKLFSHLIPNDGTFDFKRNRVYRKSVQDFMQSENQYHKKIFLELKQQSVQKIERLDGEFILKLGEYNAFQQKLKKSLNNYYQLIQLIDSAKHLHHNAEISYQL